MTTIALALIGAVFGLSVATWTGGDVNDYAASEDYAFVQWESGRDTCLAGAWADTGALTLEYYCYPTDEQD